MSVFHLFLQIHAMQLQLVAVCVHFQPMVFLPLRLRVGQVPQTCFYMICNAVHGLCACACVGGSVCVCVCVARALTPATASSSSASACMSSLYALCFIALPNAWMRHQALSVSVARSACLACSCAERREVAPYTRSRDTKSTRRRAINSPREHTSLHDSSRHMRVMRRIKGASTCSPERTVAVSDSYLNSHAQVATQRA